MILKHILKTNCTSTRPTFDSRCNTILNNMKNTIDIKAQINNRLTSVCLNF